MTRVLIVGGGLAGGLLALRLARERRDVELTVLERGPRLGGVHTWSFHESDLGPAERELVAPLVERSWPGYEVRFPDLERRVGLGYAAFRSPRLDEAVRAAWPRAVRVNQEVETLTARGARVKGGGWVPAECVIDARGAPAPSPAAAWGYQVFLGQDLALEQPHGLAGPVVMDATVLQQDAFRFVYVLPWDERSALVEDTCYGPAALPREAARARVRAWVEREGWRIKGVLREEEGVLPVPLSARLDDVWCAGAAAPLGVRAGLFHATTGYSLPWAARLAVSVAALPRLETEAVSAHVRAEAEREWRAQGFFRLLNRMLFQAAGGPRRYRVLERFYRMPEGLVARFYAGRPTLADRVRLLSGRAPVPVLRALRAAWSARAEGRA